MNDPAVPSGHERRKHRRLPEIFIVTYHLKAPVALEITAEGKEFAGVGMDISESGLGVDITRPIAVGVLTKMKFRLVNSVSVSSEHRERAFHLEGECRYCELTPNQSYRVGILFKNATDQDRRFIGVYVKDQTLAKAE